MNSLCEPVLQFLVNNAGIDAVLILLPFLISIGTGAFVGGKLQNAWAGLGAAIVTGVIESIIIIILIVAVESFCAVA